MKFKVILSALALVATMSFASAQTPQTKDTKAKTEQCCEKKDKECCNKEKGTKKECCEKKDKSAKHGKAKGKKAVKAPASN